MSYRMKITLPDPIMAQLQELATSNGEPVSRARLETAGAAALFVTIGCVVMHTQSLSERRSAVACAAAART